MSTLSDRERMNGFPPDLTETTRRLDFEAISVKMPSQTLVELREEADRIHSRMRYLSSGLLQGTAEVIESVVASANKFEGIDVTKLEKSFSDLASEFINLEGENSFLERLVDACSLQSLSNLVSSDAHDEEFQTLREAHFKIQRETAEATEEITFLIETFGKDIKNFEDRYKNTEQHLYSCLEKIGDFEKLKASQDLLKSGKLATCNKTDIQAEVDQLEEELSILKAEEAGFLKHMFDPDIQELTKSTLEMKLELLRVEKEIDSKKRELECCQNLANKQIRAELLQTIVEFLTGVSVVGFEDGNINLILRTPAIINSSVGDLSIPEVVKTANHKMHIKVNE
eukprot:c16686_g2_i1 orf=2-1021(-)